MNSPESANPDRPEDAANQDSVDIDDAMLDVLLAELLAGQSPPDQSRAIIRRLDEPVKITPTARSTSGSNSAASKSSSWSAVIGAAAAVLLCLGIGFGFRQELGFVANQNLSTPTNPLKPSIALESSGRLAANAPENGGILEKLPATQPRASNPRPSRSLELAAGTVADLPDRNPLQMFRDPSQSLPSRIETAPLVAQSLTLVSTSLTNHLQRYWSRAGVRPTEMLSADAIATRLAEKLDVHVPTEAIGDTRVMLQNLDQAGNIEALSIRILATISSRPAESLTGPSELLMSQQIADTLRSGKGFDRLVAAWFIDTENLAASPSANQENSEQPDSDAVASFGSLLQPLGQHEAIVSTAAVTLGADLRCQRCHDIREGHTRELTTQHDYWQLTANISPWLNRKPTAPAGWFYDAPDGRRRVAQPNTGADWRDALLGSRALAEGLVGTMWKMVHGRPLESSPYDLSGSASDVDLRQLRNDLANDLIANDFNLLRTISLMLTDSVVGRSTPAAMTPTGLLTASNDDWMQAVSTVESFAAAPPQSLPSLRRERMLLVQQSDVPQTGSTDGAASVLAQSMGAGDEDPYDGSAGKSRSLETITPSPAMLAGLPLRATIVMPAWVGGLPDFDSRLDHIAHLAGLVDAPSEARELANQMQAAGVEEALILQRIWWIIRPQG